jgi:hypothetical protein
MKRNDFSAGCGYPTPDCRKTYIEKWEIKSLLLREKVSAVRLTDEEFFRIFDTSSVFLLRKNPPSPIGEG